MFELPQLQYAYDALEPAIDKKTMTIHHTKHHQGYTNKCNAALEGTPLEGKDIEYILTHLDEAPAEKNKAITDNAGGFYNHSLFWTSLSPNGGGQPNGKLLELIIETFGSFDNFKEQMTKKALTVFGSGWARLCIDESGKLCLKRTSAQNNPISKGLRPLLGIDVWEHAYYIHYQNRRAEYIEARWTIINWEEVQNRLDN